MLTTASEGFIGAPTSFGRLLASVYSSCVPTYGCIDEEKDELMRNARCGGRRAAARTSAGEPDTTAIRSHRRIVLRGGNIGATMCFWVSLIVLIILLATTPPTYPYSRQWGYYPFGGVAVLLLLLLILWWFAWLPTWYYPVRP
jgi:hypothetical protein